MRVDFRFSMVYREAAQYRMSHFIFLQSDRDFIELGNILTFASHYTARRRT